MSEVSQALVVRSSTDLAQLDELDALLVSGEAAFEVVEDPEEIRRQIILQLLASESEEQLESFGEARGWREYAVPLAEAKQGGGTPFEIHGFRWRPSSFEEGSSVYFIVDATNLSTGERETLTTGSGNVLAALSWLARHERLPATRILVEKDERTKQGYKPLWLISPPGSDEEAVEV